MNAVEYEMIECVVRDSNSDVSFMCLNYSKYYSIYSTLFAKTSSYSTLFHIACEIASKNVPSRKKNMEVTLAPSIHALRADVPRKN